MLSRRAFGHSRRLTSVVAFSAFEPVIGRRVSKRIKESIRVQLIECVHKN